MKLILLDCVLPTCETDKIMAILKANNMPVRIPDGGGWNFNCWGFVSFYYGWEKRAKWVDREIMEEHLRCNSSPIDKGEVFAGDVAVFRRGEGFLTHTAIVTPDSSIICHKPGANALCIDTLKNASLSYGQVSYVRPMDLTETETVL